MKNSTLLNFKSILSLYYLSADFSLKFVGDDPNYKNDLYIKSLKKDFNLNNYFFYSFTVRPSFLPKAE